MDNKLIVRGAMTSTDVLALLSGERRYGVPDLTTAAIFEQPIPEGLQPMVDELRSMLKLPRLSEDATRSDIFAAYGHDITLLDGCRSDFKKFINCAVQASIVHHLPIKVAGKIMSIWDYIDGHLPAMAHAPLIELTAEIAAEPGSMLLPHLKREVDKAVTMLFKIVCLWLDATVTREFVGLLKVAGPDTGRYHYFRPLQTEKMLKHGDERVERVSYDPTKPYGQRTQYEKRADAVVEITHQLERHDHDIVNMRVDTIENYPDPMPSRVINLLDKTSDFIRRHLRVVSGVIVREQVLRRTTDVTTEDTTIVVSAWLDSPAILLAGVYTPIGWSGRDMENEPIRFFSGQKACPPAPSGFKQFMPRLRQNRTKIIMWSLIVIPPVTVAGLLMWNTGVGIASTCGIVALAAALWIRKTIDNS